MYAFLIVIHSIVSFGLIVAVLLHRGKGQGLSSMMGGGAMPSTFAGSGMVEKNLNRITIAFALIFVVTSVSLYFTSPVLGQ